MASLPQIEVDLAAGAAAERAQEVGALFKEHNRLLVRFLRLRLGSEHEAKEVAQEAYVRLLELDRTGAVSFLKAYLYRIAANLAIDRLRDRCRRPHHESVDIAGDDLLDTIGPDRMAIATEELALLGAALGELPDRCRKAFELSRFEDLTQVEIARRLNMSERMIRNYLLYAMTYCRLRMNGMTRDEAKKECKE